ncbi:MAG TPA: thioredoxin domain-containing protein [Bacteroidales bacterium]|nr:thioredoxin domain-containing protein [Bacteroidales bacterium]
MENKAPNLLIHEASPYLRQHAHNPVDWKPWNEETLSFARDIGKPLIISIGYSACHWCHVMERESFMDEEVARLMNAEYTSIKVDREERPDVDQVYMQSAYLINGNGGWPLNVIALPDGRPVYAGTYFPRDRWMEVLSYFAGLYATNRDILLTQADKLAEGMKEQLSAPVFSDQDIFSGKIIDAMAEKVYGRFDPREGGLHGAPKFPMPQVMEFLLQYYYHSGDSRFLEVVKTSLFKMAAGGIYDQLGGGFCRYSTDAEWKVPHFEKMLYDNGQLLSLYANAHSIDPDPVYEKVIRQTIAFAERELMSEEGGFYSAIDADSEGKEGKFYTWTKSEVLAIAGDSGEAFCEHFGITAEGNWEMGINILLRKPVTSGGESLLPGELDSICKKLFAEREKRIRPGLDDKILTSWNALMLNGLLEAYRVLNDEYFLKLALQNARFLENHMLARNGKVYRSYHKGKTRISGFLDDHAFLAMAFIKLYRVTYETRWLEHALDITRFTLGNFYDPDNKCFYLTAADGPALILRPTEYTDNVIPSPVSVTSGNLLALSSYYDLAEFKDIFRETVLTMVPVARKNPVFHANWARHIMQWHYGQQQIIITGPEADDFAKALDRHFLPSSILAVEKKRGTFSLFEYKYIEGRTLIYVCSKGICHEACETVGQALDLLREERKKMYLSHDEKDRK